MNTNKMFHSSAIILIIIWLCTCDQIDPNYSYDNFMKQFNRTYEGQEKDNHEKIFNKNYAELLQKNKNGANLNINNFLDWNQTQLSEFLNYRPQKLGRKLSRAPLRSSLYLSPTSFDWRSLGRVTPIKDQLNCGGCWAFSTTAQYQSLLAIQTNGTIFDLSQQYAIQCQKISSNGCGGGYPLTALQLYNLTGIPLETSYPFKQSQPTYYSSRGKAICTDTNRIKLQVQTLQMKHYSDLTTEQIQQQLIDSGPLTVAVSANNQQFLYASKTGLINNCPPDAGPDHAVLLVGYNSTHWFIKNSWGINWGHNGYGYILKTNDCKISTWVDVMQIRTGSVVANPNMTGYTQYNITMVDSKGDGWNGNILAFMQDNTIVATFGSSFDTGKNYGPQSVRIKSNVQTKIVVVQKGNFTNQVGFTIKNKAGTVLITRNTGTTFQANTIFKDFCPSTSCPAPTTVDYTVTLTDQYGDGWNGVVLGFRQNGTVQKFGQSYTTGSQYPATIYTFKKLVNVEIIVQAPGAWTQEIGYIIRNQQGYVVAQRSPGTGFDANSILGTFCPQCVNLSPVRIVGNTENRQEQEVIKVLSSQEQIIRLQQVQRQNKSVIKGLLISTIVLGSLLVMVLIGVGAIFVRKLMKNSQGQGSDEDLKGKTGSVTTTQRQGTPAGSIDRMKGDEVYDTNPVKLRRVQNQKNKA